MEGNVMPVAYDIALNDSWVALFGVVLFLFGVGVLCAVRWAWIFVSGLLRKPVDE